MMEGFDINAEYERIFGVKHRASLFDGDEQYAHLRQEIIDAPTPEFKKKGNLPFERIKLLPYDEFLRSEIVKEFEDRNIQTFFIRKYENKELVCYGAGYFNIKSSKFVVFRLSFSRFNEYHKFILEKSYPLKRASYNGFFVIENGFIKIAKHLSFDTASLAASFVLGRSATFDEWKDHKGKSLNSYYTRFRNLEQDSPEFISVPVFVQNVRTDELTQQSEAEDLEDGIRKVMMLLQSPLTNIITSIQALNSTMAHSDIQIP